MHFLAELDEDIYMSIKPEATVMQTGNREISYSSPGHLHNFLINMLDLFGLIYIKT